MLSHLKSPWTIPPPPTSPSSVGTFLAYQSTKKSNPGISPTSLPLESWIRDCASETFVRDLSRDCQLGLHERYPCLDSPNLTRVEGLPRPKVCQSNLLGLESMQGRQRLDNTLPAAQLCQLLYAMIDQQHSRKEPLLPALDFRHPHVGKDPPLEVLHHVKGRSEERRVRTEGIDLGYRDLACLADGLDDTELALDGMSSLGHEGSGGLFAHDVARAIEVLDDVRRVTSGAERQQGVVEAAGVG